MFYKKGIDITNDKQMFNFLKEHFTYKASNSYSAEKTIANNVKLYNLNLSGSWDNVLNFLEAGEYDTIRFMIEDWEQEHRGYEVCFNGRSSGYLVLVNCDNPLSVLPDEISCCRTYEEYKSYCRRLYGSVKENREELKYYTKLVQDFDRFCDNIRDFCELLSNLDFGAEMLNKSVEIFNDEYASDLEELKIEPLACVNGQVYIHYINKLKCLYEAFFNIVDYSKFGYRLKLEDGEYVRLAVI